MSSHSPEHRGLRRLGAVVLVLALAVLIVIGVTSYARETRDFHPQAFAAAPAAGPRGGALHAGPSPESTQVESAGRPGEYKETAQALYEGQQLFQSMNCAGCHSDGGGGMGADLMDARWFYGHEPRQIFDTIVQGRQNGMPSFGGRIPAYQVWELVAYVRSLSGLVSPDVSSGRNDHMEVMPPPMSLRMKSRLMVKPLPPVDSAAVKGTTVPRVAIHPDSTGAKGAP